MAAHRQIVQRQRILRNFRDRSNPLEELTADEVFARYRFHPDTIMDVLRRLPDLSSPTQRNIPVPPLLQVLVTLRFLGTGATHILVGDDIKISRSTAGRCIRRVSSLIAELAPQFISFPRGDRARQVMVEFSHISGFPRVLGCIDGTHIRITKQSGPQEADFVNRKQYHSLNVQMVCDPSFKITSSSCNWPGATHDNRIFKMSALCQQFEQGDHDGLLLGDSGYQCRPFLMTPFVSPANESEKQYNNSLCRTVESKNML
ncbi:putative nuclease HARBI1 [Saccostrea cucullata]|uniref:putative nuclease HARBI1 n=1 Tax=Saccostrea cuccullata TaxID=36930 RepID=UPI002ED14307